MEVLFNRLKEYNYWNGERVQVGFTRTTYLDRIIDSTGNRLIKVLVGQRRAGKSYLLRQIIHTLIEHKEVDPKRIFYFSKEYLAFSTIETARDLESLYLYYRNQFDIEGKVYVFLDEIQNVAQWELFVNSYSQDITNDSEFFITGSNSTMLSGELASRLSGRYVEFEVFSFNYNEYCSMIDVPLGRDSFLQFIRDGGLPETFHLNSSELKRNYVAALKNTIVLRDIVDRNKIQDIQLLEDIFAFLMTNIGNLTSISSIVNYFKSRNRKTNYETVSTYVQYLVNTFIFHEAERYNIRGKKVLGGASKFYLNDLAFKTYLYGIYPEDAGSNLENYVYQRLRQSGYKVHVGVIKDQEIDFIATRDRSIVYIQVCYLLSSKEVLDREFGNLLKIRDNHPKMVISMDDIRYDDFQGIIHMHPWELDLT
jgi:predicted AAA+ superfamily ATPase